MAAAEPNFIVEESQTADELLQSLQSRADTLLTEFRAFQTFLQSKNQAKSVETRIFRRGVEAESNNLGNIAERQRKHETDLNNLGSTEHGSRSLQALRSSNLPFYEAVWHSARSCTGIRAVGKRLYWDDDQKHAIQNSHPPRKARAVQRSRRKQLRSALVDVVADDGVTWIKVSIVTAKRLIFEIAKEGWEKYGDFSDEENSQSDSEDLQRPPSPTSGKLEIVRLAEDLRDAAAAIRVKFRHPQVKFVLPRIQEGKDDSVDAIIADIRATGAIVECGIQSTSTTEGSKDAPLTREDFTRMAPSSGMPDLTSTINVDCTILLALISDISHVESRDLPPSPSNSSGTYHVAILRQIESEESAPLLPSDLYPTLAGKKLVCTSLAAHRMREIVQTMGTKSERERGDILLGEGKYSLSSSSPDDIKKAWQSRSCHAFPDNIDFPITVAEFTFPLSNATQELITADTLTSPHFQAEMAAKLVTSTRLSPINASVFMYSWINDIVTLTSNKVVAAGIEKALNQILDDQEKEERDGVHENGGGDDDDKSESIEQRREGGAGTKKQRDRIEFVGPKMYVCETARSLIGKEKINGLRP
jgi:hypothetical protein